MSLVSGDGRNLLGPVVFGVPMPSATICFFFGLIGTKSTSRWRIARFGWTRFAVSERTGALWAAFGRSVAFVDDFFGVDGGSWSNVITGMGFVGEGGRGMLAKVLGFDGDVGFDATSCDKG